MQVKSKCTEEAKIVFVWFFRVLFVSKAVLILSGSGSTESLQPISKSLSSARKTVTFVSL